MDLYTLKSYCLTKPGALEAFPFDFHTLVFKVGSKMFALTDIHEQILTVNLKCDPDLADELRQSYPAITPGYHMNKRHWNTIRLDGTIPDEQIQKLIDHSYQLVVSSLKKAEKELLK
jgi:predicted DNA-binding protein (MmcQ/YjbR family)